MGKELLMDEATLERVISRIAHQILEKCTDPTNIGIIGMQTRGVHLSNQLADVMNEIVKSTVPKGVLDISFYRDDYRTKQMDVKSTDVPYDINGKDIILVDDVLYTGRTIRAALDAIMDLGRPKSVRLVVLVDRGHRELPIRADFTGKKITTAENQKVAYHAEAIDGENSLWLLTDEEA